MKLILTACWVIFLVTAITNNPVWARDGGGHPGSGSGGGHPSGGGGGFGGGHHGGGDSGGGHHDGGGFGNGHYPGGGGNFGGRHYGGWDHGGNYSRFSWGIGLGYASPRYYGGYYPYYGGYGGYREYYGGYYAYPPAVVTVPVPVSPPVYIQQQAPVSQSFQPGYWYYCSDPEGYYPYIKDCLQAWQQVEPRPPITR